MSNATILIVDDEPASPVVLSQTLGDEYRVRAASSRPQALQAAAAKQPPALVAEQEHAA